MNSGFAATDPVRPTQSHLWLWLCSTKPANAWSPFPLLLIQPLWTFLILSAYRVLHVLGHCSYIHRNSGYEIAFIMQLIRPKKLAHFLYASSSYALTSS